MTNKTKRALTFVADVIASILGVAGFLLFWHFIGQYLPRAN